MERVFQPLGITTAGFGPMGTVGLEDQPLQHTSKYVPVEPEPTADLPMPNNAAGRLHMSIVDWGKYIQWVLACEVGNQTLLRAETAQALITGAFQTPEGISLAHGWAVIDDRPWTNGRALFASGSNLLNFSLAAVALKRNLGVIVATNIAKPTLIEAKVSMETIAERLVDFHLNAE